MADAHPQRGRPPKLSTADLRSRAITVVSAHGYDAVTMGIVATEIGVSLRTLHRHFPSKADLVWGALDDSFEQLRDQLAAAPHDMSIIAAIESAIFGFFRITQEDNGQQRERLRLIAITPELQYAQSDAFRQWRKDIAAFAASRLELPADDLIPLAIAASVQSAMLTGLTWWAMHSDTGQPSEAVGRALRALHHTGL